MEELELFERCAECRAYLTTADTHDTLCRWCVFYATYPRHMEGVK